jgi:uncharacterized protein (UPF0248 family)
VTIVFIAKYLFTGSVKILNKIVFKIAIKFISVRNPEISYCLYSTVYIHNGTKGGKKQIFIKDISEISPYIDSHLVGKRAKRIFSRRMRMVFGFGLNHTLESSARAKYTIYLPSFLAAIHYYVAFHTSAENAFRSLSNEMTVNVK